MVITGTFIRGWPINRFGYVQLVSNVKTLNNCKSITVKVFSWVINVARCLKGGGHGKIYSDFIV